MPLRIEQIGADRLAEYAGVSIAFRVESILAVRAVSGGLAGLALVEEPVDPPYVKDYEEHPEAGARSNIWPDGVDLGRWGLFLAYRPRGRRPAGAATVAVDTAGIHMLEGRADLAVLWDIRVRPDARGQGIGTALFRHAAAWARGRGCTQLKIETQNVNVPACRFYARQGCELGGIHRYAYAGCPPVAHEAMLLWYLDLR